MNRLFSSKTTAPMMASQIRKVTHVIFDMDGLLLDTERLYTVATQNILDAYGQTYTWEAKASVMGMQSHEMAEKLVAIYELPMTPEEYLALAKEQYDELMPTAALMPDTEKIYYKIIEDVLKQFNKPYPWETRMRVLGTTEMKCCQICVDDLKLPCDAKEFHRRYTKLGHELLGDCDLLPGAEKLVRHLHSHNIPICLATSSGAEHVKIKTQNHQELFSLFHHKVMGSTDPDVKNGKPAPDIFLIAAQRFSDQPRPADCLVFEDAPNGVRAANSAGMQVVMCPDHRVGQEERDEATVAINSLLDVDLEAFGLPALPK